MRLAPGADLKALQKCKPGETITVDAGAYSGAVTLTGLTGFHLILTGAIIHGGTDGVKLVNCHDFDVTGGEVQDAKSYGWFLEGCKRFTFNGTKATRAGITGWLTTQVDDASFLGCSGMHSAGQHGLYISNRAAKVRIIGGEYSFNNRAGVQINCDHGGAMDVEVRQTLCEHNQDPGGAAAIQLAYVTGGRVLNNTISDHMGRAGIALFWHTKGVTVDSNRFGFAAGKGAACISRDSTAMSNTIGAMNQADPRVPLVGRG